MSVHRTKRGGWEVRWRQGARHRSRTLDRRDDAMRFDAEVRRASQLGHLIPPRTGGETLGDFALRWLETRRNLAPKTRKVYANVLDVHVDPYLGHFQLSDIRPSILVDWQEKRLKDGAGVEAMNKAVKLLGQIFDHAQRLEIAVGNPARLLERTRSPKRTVVPATPEQIERIRDWFLARDRPGDATLVSFLAYVGARPMEALALRWTDIKDGRVAITKALTDGLEKDTKNHHSRWAEVISPVAQDLREWRIAMSGSSDLIWPRRRDGLVWRQADWNNWRRRWFDKAKVEAGLPAFVPYDSRHTAASLFIAGGRPTTEVAAQLGHSLAVTHTTYAHLIESMRGEPVRPMYEWVQEARALRTKQVLDRPSFGESSEQAQ